MWVKSIRYYNFRNIENLQMDLQPGLNVLVGANGQGKTNFVEGICLCLSGESFRYGDKLDLVHFEHKQSSVSMTVEGAIDSSVLEFNELKVTIENGRKYHWLNEKKISSNKLFTRFPVILFSPESLSTIKEGHSQRRDLIDQFLVSCPDRNYQGLFDQYTRILKSKNKILKAFCDKELSRDQTERILESYQDKFLELAVDVTFHRIQGIIQITDEFNKVSADLYPNPVDISVEYLISSQNALHYSKAKLFEVIKNRLSELRAAEMTVGHSLVGPQKHDIVFLANGRDSRTFCSQGQQRALILAFKLAQLMYHRRVYNIMPILFLDDVLSELDGTTRGNLIRLLNMTEGQIFITTTDRYLCRELSHQTQRYIAVDAGKFSVL